MRATATIFATCLLALPTLSCAQANRPVTNARNAQNRVVARAPKQDKNDSNDQSPRRLETVTWNSVKHELTWTVSKGQKEKDSYRALSNANYEISMDNATMTFQGETRRFSKQEAINVHALMDVIAKYAVDSTIWWDDGQGEKLDKHGNPVEPPGPKNKGKDQEIDRPAGDGVAILHVSYIKPAAVQAQGNPALRAEIERLERRLAELKRIEATNDKRLNAERY